jgi:hypothetical protein
LNPVSFFCFFVEGLPVSKYDAAILGAGVAGCVLGASLAKAGKRAVIIDSSEEPGGLSKAVDLQGNRLSGWPNCAYGFQEGGAWNVLFRQLGILSLPYEGDALYQVALPDRRVTVHPRTEETLEELRREYPAEIDALRRFYSDLETIRTRMSRSKMLAFVARRRTARTFLRSYGFSRELLAFYSASSVFFFGRHVQELSLAELVTLVTTAPQAATGRLKNAIAQCCDFVAGHGGACEFGEAWPTAVVRSSRLEGLQTTREKFDVRSTVLNICRDEREDALFAVVRDAVIPVGMLETVLSVSDYGQPEEVIALSLEPQGPLSPGGVRLLRVFNAGKTGQIFGQNELLKRASDIVPFLLDFTAKTAFQDSSERSAESVCGESVSKRLQTIGPLRTRSLPVRGLYMLEDTRFGVLSQANTIRDLADQIA